MTTTDIRPAADRIELRQGETASIPVPEGRLVLKSESMPNGLAQKVVVLYPHGDATPHVLARFANGSFDEARMMLVALAALEAWK